MGNENRVEDLRRLCEADGVSGEEGSAAAVALELLKKQCAAAYVDQFHNVIGWLKERDDSKKTLLFEAHIDEIGLIVTYIEDSGFVRVHNCGGIDTRLLAAQSVTLHGDKAYKGVIATLPPHAKADTEKAAKISDISIDTGFSKEQLAGKISLGDKVTIDSSFGKMLGNRVTGKALDNRSGVYAVLLALEKLKDLQTKYNVAVLFSCQEEVDGRGAQMGAYNINPDYAIAVDVSFAKAPGTKPQQVKEMGKGVMIGISSSLSRELSNTLTSLAEKNEIAYQLEVMGGRTGTDADAIVISRGGVVTGLLSIPQKNMHMPIEIVDVEDIEATAKLLAEFAKEGM